MTVKWSAGDRVKAVFDTVIYAGAVESVASKGKRVTVVFDDGESLTLSANELLPENDEDDTDEARGFNQYPVVWDKERINFTVDVIDCVGNKAHFYGQWRRTQFAGGIHGFAIDMWCQFNGYPYSVESTLYLDDPRERPSSMSADICAMANKFLHQRLDGSALTLDDLRKKADQPILELKTVDELDNIIATLREFRNLGVRAGGSRCCTLSVPALRGTEERVPKIGVALNFTTARALSGTSNYRVDDDATPAPAGATVASAKKRKGRRAKDGGAAVTSSKASKEMSDDLEELTNRLRTSADKGEKRRIRARLRELGHKGGLKSK